MNVYKFTPDQVSEVIERYNSKGINIPIDLMEFYHGKRVYHLESTALSLQNSMFSYRQYNAEYNNEILSIIIYNS